MTTLHHDHRGLPRMLRNWILPWGFFALLFLVLTQFIMWPISILGALVGAAIVADHCCD